MSKEGYYTIGEAVGRLQGAYPELSISKVRYLEEEGLLALTRTKGGYRQFTESDLSRLAVILKLQRDNFLPLNVIKQRLDSGAVELESDVLDAADEPNGETGLVPMNEAATRSGLSPETVKSLESFGLISPVAGTDGKSLSAGDLQLLVSFAQLQRYGIESRHLRMYVNFAEREALLFQQILSPKMRQRDERSRQHVRDELQALVQLTEKIKRVLLQRSVDDLEAKH